MLPVRLYALDWFVLTFFLSPEVLLVSVRDFFRVYKRGTKGVAPDPVSSSALPCLVILLTSIRRLPVDIGSRCVLRWSAGPPALPQRPPPRGLMLLVGG